MINQGMTWRRDWRCTRFPSSRFCDISSLTRSSWWYTLVWVS